MATVANRIALANKLIDRFGPRVATLFGLDYAAPTSVGLGQMEERGAGAQSTYHGGIEFSQQFLKNSSRADFRGALIHELTHVQGAAYGKDKKAEVAADYARYMLNPKEAEGWNPSAGVLAMAEKRGTVGGYQGTKGPTTGNNNRRRDTLTNGRGVPPPPVSPASAVAYAGQTATATQALYNKIAELRAQAGMVKGQFVMDRSAVKTGRIQGQVAAEADALGRGIVGSSADLGGRAAVDAQAAAGLQQAVQAKVQGMLGIKTARLSATNDYYTQLYQIQAAKAAEQQTSANDAFMNDLVMRMGDETATNPNTGGGGGPGGGAGGGRGGRGPRPSADGAATYGGGPIPGPRAPGTYVPDYGLPVPSQTSMLQQLFGSGGIR